MPKVPGLVVAVRRPKARLQPPLCSLQDPASDCPVQIIALVFLEREGGSFAAEHPGLSVIFGFYHGDFILQVQRIAVFSFPDFRKIWAS